MRRALAAILIGSMLGASAPLAAGQTPHPTRPARAGGAVAGGALPEGTYVGTLVLDSGDHTEGKFAVTAEVLTAQPDPSSAPRRAMHLKLQLGGYGTPEYIGELFDDIDYDAGDGRLALDAVSNDLVVIGAVSHDGADPNDTTISGRVEVRSASVGGRLLLKHQHPQASTAPDAEVPFIPNIAGQYEGVCGSQHAALQIGTGRGLGRDDTGERGFERYGIGGRLAFDQPEYCGDTPITANVEPAWCVSRNFVGGSYNIYSGKLILREPQGATSCRASQGRLICHIRILDAWQSCDLQRVDMTPRLFQAAKRAFHLEPTPDQLAALPEPGEPPHAEIVAALRGRYVGFLHHETSDRYQPLRLDISASVNGHVNITGIIKQYFGRDFSGEAWQQQLDRRAFSSQPNLTLASRVSDLALQVKTWRRGYLEAVMYSRAFGRVGSIELVKGDGDSGEPLLPSAAKVVGSIAGAYQSPNLSHNGNDMRWWFEALIPTQPADVDRNYLSFDGSMTLTGGLGSRIRIAQASYDVFADALAWFTLERAGSRMVTGYFDDRSVARLLVPGAPIWGVLLPKYEFMPFERTASDPPDTPRSGEQHRADGASP